VRQARYSEAPDLPRSSGPEANGEPGGNGSAAGAGVVIQADHWTEPLTSSDLGASPNPRHDTSLVPISWLASPAEQGCTPVIALWVRRAILADPEVVAWHRDQAPRGRARSAATPQPETVEQLGEAISQSFQDEGGAEAVEAVMSATAAAHLRDLAGRDPGRAITRKLPNGLRIRSAVSEVIARSPVVMLTFPTGHGLSTLQVLRDARLGQLASTADTLAERYLIPASEIVFCILTGQVPRIAPIRLGTRFRRFDVDGMPVTAASRVVLDVDPQMEAAELARTFVHWQRASGVRAAKPSPKLVSLAAELLGKVSLAPAEQDAHRNTHPSELLGVGSRSWWLIPAVPWVRLARETRCDPRLIRTRAAAVAHILLPLDVPRAPRWRSRSA
jgi:hypothetical protein